MAISECRGCGKPDPKDVCYCRFCGGMKCATCNMGDDVECATCEDDPFEDDDEDDDDWPYDVDDEEED